MSSRAASPAMVPEWLENLGEWRWPGAAGAGASDVLPPSWVPALPPRAAAHASGAQGTVARPPRARSVLPAVLLAGLAALGGALALQGQLSLAGPGHNLAAGGEAVRSRALAATFSLQPLPALTPVSHDAAGSMIAHVSFSSVSLHGRGGFLVYLPPRYDSARRYPVLYLLHGNEQLAVEFLRQGNLQNELDGLIGSGQVPPMIAVMPEGGRGAINWRNIGSQNWESYVVEIQELVDRMLPTIRERDARAIAGDSMGAYGAMNVALGNPYRFGVVESWLGFFNGLEPQLRLDRPVIRRLGLTAFVYGAEEDHIANPAEDAPFAAALRANGADATSALYPGEHNMQTVQQHLASQLLIVGRAFRHAEGSSHRE
jgi:enterochelin esterase-like enzyme